MCSNRLCPRRYHCYTLNARPCPCPPHATDCHHATDSLRPVPDSSAHSWAPMVSDSRDSPAAAVNSSGPAVPGRPGHSYAAARPVARARPAGSGANLSDYYCSASAAAGCLLAPTACAVAPAPPDVGARPSVLGWHCIRSSHAPNCRHDWLAASSHAPRHYPAEFPASAVAPVAPDGCQNRR